MAEKKKPKKVPYRVQPGDNLRVIAEKVLGDSSKWKELRDAGITKDDLEVGKPIKIPRKLVTKPFLRRQFSRRAMNADEELQRVRRATDLERQRIGDDIRRDRNVTQRELARTYEAFRLERDRQLRDTQQGWNARGVGMSGMAEQDVEETRSLLDSERQEWETRLNDDLRDRQRERRRGREDTRIEQKEAEREARIRAGERWNERQARQRATERGLI